MHEYVIIVYYILALIYIVLFRLVKRSPVKVAISLLIPYIGLLFAIWMHVSERGKPAVKVADWMKELEEEMRQERQSNPYIVSEDVQREINIVPLTEALSMSTPSVRRRLLLDALKNDAIKNVSLLEAAIENEDTETSHYAVTAVTSFRGQLMMEIQKLAVHYEQNKQDVTVLKQFASSLDTFLQSRFIDRSTRKQYQALYAEVLQRLIDTGEAEEKHFTHKIRNDIVLSNYADAREASERYLEQFPLSEEAYLLQLELYYVLRSKDEFDQTLHNLKASPIKLTNEALTTIRYWM
ncbi:hypothetical protein [Marinicrinis sediminis]|uniref:HEAT repeat domain-containing protein n=1 Tax=Marinicrinis sediminis TaxID=1652465 RepID=A0ABW5R7L8_9BACL